MELCPSPTRRSSVTTWFVSPVIVATVSRSSRSRRTSGVHPMTLQKWMRRADIDEGRRPGVSSTESAELREANKRIRLLEQENEVLRRAAAYLSQANLPGKDLPARERARHRRGTRRGVVPGVDALPPALLPVARRPGHRRRTDRSVSGEHAVRRSSRRSGVRVPVARRRSRQRRSADVCTNSVADLPRQRLVVEIRQETRPQQSAAWAARSRRPRATQFHCRCCGSVVVDRRHRAPHR
ncbi:hypothetical protein SKPI104516_19440 [Skermania piniformis]